MSLAQSLVKRRWAPLDALKCPHPIYLLRLCETDVLQMFSSSETGTVLVQNIVFLIDLPKLYKIIPLFTCLLPFLHPKYIGRANIVDMDFNQFDT